MRPFLTGRPTGSRADVPPTGSRMNCQDFEPFLFAFVDGEFDGPEKADAEAHLAQCEACRREVEVQKAFKRRLRVVATAPGALNPPAPSQLRAGLVAALAREPAPRGTLAFLRPAVLVPLSLAAAASIATVVVYLKTGPVDDPMPFINDTIAHHQRELPMDVQDHRAAAVGAFLQGKVDFAPRIPELRNASLVGARVSSHNGHPAAHVRYVSGTGAGRASLLVFDAPELRLSHGLQRIADRDVMIANRRGYSVVVWKDGEIAYSMVSAELDVLDLLDLVRPPILPDVPAETWPPCSTKFASQTAMVSFLEEPLAVCMQ